MNKKEAMIDPNLTCRLEKLTIWNFSLILKKESSRDLQSFQHLGICHLWLMFAGFLMRRLLAGECCQFTQADRASFWWC